MVVHKTSKNAAQLLTLNITIIIVMCSDTRIVRVSPKDLEINFLWNLLKRLVYETRANVHFTTPFDLQIRHSDINVFRTVEGFKEFIRKPYTPLSRKVQTCTVNVKKKPTMFPEYTCRTVILVSRFQKPEVHYEI